MVRARRPTTDNLIGAGFKDAWSATHPRGCYELWLENGSIWAWILENHTQAMCQTKSGRSSPLTSRSLGRTPLNATTICARSSTDLQRIFNGLRWIVRTGSAWRYMPHDLPPWEAVYQQTQRWIRAGVFKEMVHDLRVLLRLSEGRASEPTAAILDSRTLRSTPESGTQGGYDGHKGKKGSKVHAAVDTLGHLLALRVSPAKTRTTASRWRNSPRRYSKRPKRTSRSLT